MANSTNPKKKISFLSVALGSLIATSLSTGTAEASWSSPRCTAQCSSASFASKNMVGVGILRKSKEKVINDYKKSLNDCAANCDNTKIMNLFFPDDYENLNQANLENLQNTLKNQQRRKQGDQADIESQLKNEMGKRKPSNSKIKTLNKKQDKLIAEINELGSQIHKIEGALKAPESEEPPSPPSKEIQSEEAPNILPPSEERRTPKPLPKPKPKESKPPSDELPPIPESISSSHEIPPTPENIPSEATKIVEEVMIKADLPSEGLPLSPSRPKLELEEDVLKKIANPEGQKFIEPKIPEVEGFADDNATMRPDKATLTKWGIVKILQEAGIIVKRDPKETQTIEVPDIKNPTKKTKVIKPLGKDDADKIITNNPERKAGGSYSEAVYFIILDPQYLAEGHTQTHYVLKKNKWAFAEVSSRTENTPVKELIDLQKVQTYIVPKLSKSKYAKIATIGNSVFYLDEKGEKIYFVVLDAANGQPLIELFNKFAKTNQTKWHDIMLNAGKALGELHWLLSDQEQFKKINIKDLKLSDIKTITHGDLHMNNVFYDEKNGSVTFIDTGSMADSLREKKSPDAEFTYFFDITKYAHTLGHYDFNKLNEDFAIFADGYAQGFGKDKETQEKIKNILVDYFKLLSSDYGGGIYLKMINPAMYDQLVIPLVKSFINSVTAPNGGNMPGELIVMVFDDNYVSKDIKRALSPTLLHHNLITPEKANSELAGG